MATWPNKKFYNIFSRVGTIHQRDKQMDGHWTTAKTELSHSIARVKFTKCYQMENVQNLTKMATSACEAPPIIFGTKLLCPGASSIVKCLLSVSKNARPTSTVLPLSRSSRLVSSAHERYLTAQLSAQHFMSSCMNSNNNYACNFKN